MGGRVLCWQYWYASPLPCSKNHIPLARFYLHWLYTSMCTIQQAHLHICFISKKLTAMSGSIPRLNFRGFCLQDSPLGVRFADQVSAFPAGVNVAATWSTRLFKTRGAAMGAEHHGKGVDVQLGPVAGPIGRVPAGGRNWEGLVYYSE